jgi:hypothetical protein
LPGHGPVRELLAALPAADRHGVRRVGSLTHAREVHR